MVDPVWLLIAGVSLLIFFVAVLAVGIALILYTRKKRRAAGASAQPQAVPQPYSVPQGDPSFATTPLAPEPDPYAYAQPQFAPMPDPAPMPQSFGSDAFSPPQSFSPEPLAPAQSFAPEPHAPPMSWNEPVTPPGSWNEPVSPPGSWNEPVAPPISFSDPIPPPAPFTPHPASSHAAPPPVPFGQHAPAEPVAPPPPVPAPPRSTQASQPLPSAGWGSLIGTSGPASGRTIPIDEKGFFIGRDAGSAQVVIMNPRISKRHVWIGVKGNAVVAIDQSSTNGTYLNKLGARITETPLQPGDTIILADDAARFQYQR
jgi:hypothetical protein